MESEHIVVPPGQLGRNALALVVLSLAIGCWAGLLARTIYLGDGLSVGILWLQIGIGALLLISTLVFGFSMQRKLSLWRQESHKLKIELENRVDQNIMKLKEREFKQTQAAAVCRHENMVSTIKELHSLMTSHLNNVTTETNEAALNLINQLTLIHDAMSYLLQTVSANRKASDEMASGSQSTLEDNQATMDRLQRYIDSRLLEIDHDHQMASELQDQASIMSELTKLIESVAKQTTIVATNAKIEATRAGVYGQAFGVIADEVTNLSAQIGKSSKEIIHSIDQMGKSIEEKFKAKLDQNTKTEETTLLNGLKNQLVKMGKSYLRLEDFNRETLDTINSSSTQIKAKVNGSLMAIQFQDITQQQIEVILKSLKLFEEHLSVKSCYHQAGSKSNQFEEFDINQIRNLYVMKKQHDIHNAYHKTRKLAHTKQQDTDSGDITLF